MDRRTDIQSNIIATLLKKLSYLETAEPKAKPRGGPPAVLLPPPTPTLPLLLLLAVLEDEPLVPPGVTGIGAVWAPEDLARLTSIFLMVRCKGAVEELRTTRF